jgi:hypothetical protein
VDPEKRATFREVAAHPWTRTAGPAWERPLSSAFVVRVDRDTGESRGGGTSRAGDWAGVLG